MNQTNTVKERSRFHVGMRNIKTAMAATICALIYFLVDRNPTFACIGAVFGMGSDMRTSKQGGGNRLFGTIVGGILGMILYSIYIHIYPDGGMKPLMLLLLFVGVIMLIVCSQIIHWPGAIQPGSVMLCIILFNTPVDTYITYSLNRIVDTGIGVVVSLMINYLMPRERVLKWMSIFKKNPEEILED